MSQRRMQLSSGAQKHLGNGLILRLTPNLKPLSRNYVASFVEQVEQVEQVVQEIR